jgi:hypothetical protein
MREDRWKRMKRESILICEETAVTGCLFNPCRKEVAFMRGNNKRSRYSGIAVLIVAIAKAIAMIVTGLRK